MIITPLPDPPQTSDPANFDPDADAFIAALPTFVTQANLLEATLTASAAPGGIVATFTFDGLSAADSDPGTGKLRLSNLTQGSALVIRADNTDNLGVSAVSRFARITSTSAILATVTLMKAADPTKWFIGNATLVATPAGYTNITVQDVIISGANPFADGDALVMTIIPKGDQGDPNNWQNDGSVVTVSGSPSTITMTGFSSLFSNLKVDMALVPSTSAILNIAYSVDGSTFSGTQPLTSAQAGFYGSLILTDYRGDRPLFEARTSPGVLTPGNVQTVVDDVRYFMAATGTGVVSLRISVSTGTINNGSTLQRRVS